MLYRKCDRCGAEFVKLGWAHQVSLTYTNGGHATDACWDFCQSCVDALKEWKEGSANLAKPIRWMLTPEAQLLPGPASKIKALQGSWRHPPPSPIDFITDHDGLIYLSPVDIYKKGHHQGYVRGKRDAAEELGKVIE